MRSVSKSVSLIFPLVVGFKLSNYLGSTRISQSMINKPVEPIMYKGQQI